MKFHFNFLFFAIILLAFCPLNQVLGSGGGGGCGPADNCSGAPALAGNVTYSYSNTSCDALPDCENCFSINDCANICGCAPCANEECNTEIMGKLCSISSAFCGSPENTSWAQYCATTSGSHDFTVSNVSCSGGGASLQFGLWDANVACGSNNQSNLLDCSGGTSSTLTFSQVLVAGSCYLIFFDGNAGATCTWDFLITPPSLLPISLLDYQVSRGAEGSIITWSTNADKETKEFQILRRYDNMTREEGDSKDVQFNKMDKKNIATIPVNTLTNDENDFKFIDKDIYDPGVYIYELYQKDINGMRRFLGVNEIYVDDPPKTRLTGIFPGTEKGVYILQADVKEAVQGALNVYDLDGKRVKHQLLGNIESGYRSIELDMNELPQGIYIYELKLGGRTFAGKIMRN